MASSTTTWMKAQAIPWSCSTGIPPGPFITAHSSPSSVRRIASSRLITWAAAFPTSPRTTPIRLTRHIANLEALLDSLKLERITLFLHDWGGAIGMGYAVRHPERVKRFVIFNTAAFPASRIPFRINICKLPVFGAVAVRGFNAFAGLAPAMACAKQERMTPA